MFPFSTFKTPNRRLLESINTKVSKLMATAADMKAALDKIADGATEAKSELEADASQIKDLIAKLASTPVPAPGASSAELDALVAQANSIADGLPKKVQPVVDAVAAAPAQ